MTSPDTVLLHVEKLVKHFPIMRGTHLSETGWGSSRGGRCEF